MEITAQSVKDLREKTGAGMLDCKKALTEAGGDMDLAIENLRKKGLSAAAKKADRVAAEGLIGSFISADGRTGVLAEVNCETDFVAKNEDFIGFTSEIVQLVANKQPATVDALSSLVLTGSESVTERLNTLTAKIGEKLAVRRFVSKQVPAGDRVGVYIHLGSKIGVLVHLAGPKHSEELVKDLAMHIAAVAPRFIQKSEIPAEVLAKEKEIYLDQMKDSGKPANILEKIIDGKLQKFAADICLLDQIFIKDPTGKKTVQQVLKEVDPALSLVSFTRYQVGEGIEKKKDDFAAEVAKMVQ